MADKLKLTEHDVLIVVDVQNDFCPGGALPVPHGDEVVGPINRLAEKFANVIITQDWHTAGHISFASSHEGKKPLDMTILRYGVQVLWPDHCVQGTYGAMLHRKLWVPNAQLIIRKGFHPDTDSYSAFREGDSRHTGLEAYLYARKIRRVFLVGLATDYCVAWTAVDSVSAGLVTFVIGDACRAIDTNNSLAHAQQNMLDEGVTFITSANIA